MIRHPAFPEEAWQVHELHLDLDVLAQTESLFALANGHLGLRGNLDEGEPAGLPGTYLNSFYELRPLQYVEPGYGFPESGQTIINVTNGKLIDLLVDDEPFDVRYGRLERHERMLDMRAGTLERMVDWITPAGRHVRVTSRRLVSFTQRAIAAIYYSVEPIDAPTRVVVQSELVANEPLGHPILSSDPREGAPLEGALQSELSTYRDARVALVHRTAGSGLRVAAAMDHFFDGPEGFETSTEATPDTGRVSITARLEPGQHLCLVKFLAYGWSSQRSRQALVDQVLAALTAARHTGWEGLLAEQREYLDEFWSSADVELEGDPQVQQAVRFGLFHILQAGARGEDRPVPAKGLTGPGYDGHAFWDTETFVLPLLTCTLPPAAASALRWRQATLPAARERARQLGLEGAAFPWRTINGTESSGYWPASTAAVHVNADIADAVIRYVGMTGDVDFEEHTGLELLVETARLWHSLGHYDAANQFRIDGVTGPDEYSALHDNNVYTNLMAQQNLLAAAAVAERYPDRASTLDVTGAEIQAWRQAATFMLIPFDERLGVHQQSEGFTEHEEWDFAVCPPERYPLLLHFPYFQLYRRQVIKQPDLVLAMHLRGDAFSAEQKARNFQYYEARTVRDSSLSASTEAVMAAETGHLNLAYDYMVEAALLDIQDLEHNTRDGVHIAALAGAWIALVDGFGGMRTFGDNLCFSPRLPRQLHRLTFKLRYRGRTLEVTVTHEQATYALLDGSPVRLSHHGDSFEVHQTHPVTRPVPPAPKHPPVHQPPGRAPIRRHEI